MSEPSAPDYDQFAERLRSADAGLSPAEAHGTLCGLICGGGGAEVEALWQEAVLGEIAPGDVLAQECRQQWRGAAERTRESIEGAGLGLSLLLPPDDRPLEERAIALHQWSRGFLYGLGLLGAPQGRLSAQTQEVLGDFAEITRMDLDALEGSEENEEAFEELREFVWVAAMLVYEEVARRG
jgi:uncharacterized protein